MNTLERRLMQWGAETIDLSPEISSQAVVLIREHALARGLQLADALIAATAMVHGVTLFSGNRKHYGGIPGLQECVGSGPETSIRNFLNYCDSASWESGRQ